MVFMLIIERIYKNQEHIENPSIWGKFNPHLLSIWNKIDTCLIWKIGRNVINSVKHHKTPKTGKRKRYIYLCILLCDSIPVNDLHTEQLQTNTSCYMFFRPIHNKDRNYKGNPYHKRCFLEIDSHKVRHLWIAENTFKRYIQILSKFVLAY